jgi:hypothetical protein
MAVKRIYQVLRFENRRASLGGGRTQSYGSALDQLTGRLRMHLPSYALDAVPKKL